MNISKKNILRIVVLAVIILVIVGIYMFNVLSAPVVNEDLEIPLIVTEFNMEEIASHELPTILDFGADECVPCKEMKPVLVKVNEDMQGKAVVQFVDVWENPAASTGYPIQVIPTQVFINSDGTPYMPSEEIYNAIPGGFLMYADSDTEEHIFTVHEGGLTEAEMLLILEDMGVE